MSPALTPIQFERREGEIGEPSRPRSMVRLLVRIRRGQFQTRPDGHVRFICDLAHNKSEGNR